MQPSRTRSGGLDVHTDAIAVASVAPEHGAEVICCGTLGTRPCDSDQLLRKRPSQATPLVCGSEAGPWGSWLARSLTTKDDDCWVVAPSRMPNKAGDRVTTDRRDAGPLARLARSGDRTAVSVPKVEDEARRDLSRARAETIGALQDAPFRRKAFLLSHAIRSTGRATWSPAPLRWLSAVVCPTPAPHIVLQAEGPAVTAHTARLQRLAQARHDHVQSWRLTPVVEALQALRGVPCTVAGITVAALGDLTRFDPPRERMPCVDLIPSESFSGARRQQGAMTQAGQTHARQALVEGAWASRSPAKVRRPLPRRREKPPTALQDISWKAHVRLCHRSRRLRARGQHANQMVVAMTRAWVGFLWAMAHKVLVTPSVPRTALDSTPNAAGCQRA
jgi:transposase